MAKNRYIEIQIPDGFSALIAAPDGSITTVYPQVDDEDEADDGMKLIGAVTLALHDEDLVNRMYALLEDDVGEVFH